MAHRKNPSAQRRRRHKSSPALSIYTRNSHCLNFWTNRLNRVQVQNSFSKCTLKKKQFGGKPNNKNKKVANKKNIQKQTSAVVYYTHYSNTVYPFFSKALSFKTKKSFRKKLLIYTL